MKRIKAISISDRKGMRKKNIDSTNLITDFGLENKKIPGDGVITGSGEVNGRIVFAYSQDRTVMGGSLGEAFRQ